MTDKDKTGAGIALGIILGILGLVALADYLEKKDKRKKPK